MNNPKLQAKLHAYQISRGPYLVTSSRYKGDTEIHLGRNFTPIKYSEHQPGEVSSGALVKPSRPEKNTFFVFQEDYILTVWTLPHERVVYIMTPNGVQIGTVSGTLQLGKERKQSLDLLNNAWHAAPEFEPHSSIMGEDQQTYRVRSCGLAAFIAHQARIHGIECIPIRQMYYREEASLEKAKMWFSGFKLVPLGSRFGSAKKVVKAEFINMGR